MIVTEKCQAEHCDRPHHARGWCTKHYQRWLKGEGKQSERRRKPAPVRQRLMRHIAEVGTGCWLWTSTRHPEGYGLITVAGRSVLAHRVAYEEFRGAIPAGLTIDHLCRNRACVNPDHLEPVTQRENTRRSPIARAAVNARKTHCSEGHAFDEANTYEHGGSRYCRACHREAQKRYLQRTA